MKERYIFRAEVKEQDEECEVVLYSSIAADKFWGDEYTPADLDKALKEAKAKGAKRLNMRVNSGGGEVFAAVAMRSIIINAEFESVRIMIEGLCASAATLFATIPEAHVVIADGSAFMIHNPMTVAWGNAEDLEHTIEILHKMEESFQEMYAAKTGKDKAQIKKWMDAETWFMARSAVEEGFCDELLESEKMVACVTRDDVDAMRRMYNHVPEGIPTMEAGTAPNAAAGQREKNTNGSTENPVAGFSSVINPSKEETKTMEIKDITREQLCAENPALAEEIRNSAIQAERERIEEIDALTDPGYEAMAEEAKRTGMSAMDYQKAIVKAKKEKGPAWLNARKQETAPAAQVRGDAPTGAAEKEDDEIKAFQKEISGYFNASGGDGTMF